jgi:hypothetical protein
MPHSIRKLLPEATVYKLPSDPGHETAVGVALAFAAVLDEDEDPSVDVSVVVDAEVCDDGDELLVPDEVEETELLMTLAPQTEGTFAAGPTLDLR